MKLSPFKMMSAIKSGVVSHSRFAKMAERDFKVSPLSLSFVSIPDICHERHEYIGVNFFGRCKFLQI